MGESVIHLECFDLKDKECFDFEEANTRVGSRTPATSKMELFVIIVNGFQPLTIITKCSILDVAAVLDPPLNTESESNCFDFKRF